MGTDNTTKVKGYSVTDQEVLMNNASQILGQMDRAVEEAANNLELHRAARSTFLMLMKGMDGTMANMTERAGPSLKEIGEKAVETALKDEGKKPARPIN